MKTGRGKKSSDSGEDKPAKKKTKVDAPPSFNFTPNFTPQRITNIVTPPSPNTLVGKPFADAISALRDGGDTGVHTKFNLNVKASGRQESVPVQADFSIKNQGTGLTQGMMDTPNFSAYVGKQEKSSVLPKNLSLQRGILESRAMKQLSDSGDGYKADSKVSQFDELKMTQKNEFPKQTVLGGIALGSFLEDVTAKRAVGLEDVGSAMRAKTMAKTWNMKTEGAVEVKGFQTEMLDAFPQLGKSTIKAGGLDESGISAIKKHWDANGKKFTKEKQVENIVEAHKEAYTSAAKRFEHKWTQISKQGNTTGKWWDAKADEIKGINEGLQSESSQKREGTANQEFKNLGDDYVKRKMTRHGIKF
jgi:hypothetical protein